MRSNNTVRFLNSILLITAILSLTTVSAFAQETQETVVDEVIAQINEDVITLSQVKREMKFATESLIQQGKTPTEQVFLIEVQLNAQAEENLVRSPLSLTAGS